MSVPPVGQITSGATLLGIPGTTAALLYHHALLSLWVVQSVPGSATTTSPPTCGARGSPPAQRTGGTTAGLNKRKYHPTNQNIQTKLTKQKQIN